MKKQSFLIIAALLFISILLAACQPKGETVTFEGDYVLVSVGRKPYTEGLGLENAGVQMGERGMIAVNDHLETNVPGIYAIGDVVRGAMLDELGHDYVRTARAKGLSRGKVIWKHCLRNAFLPVLTYLGPAAAWQVLSGDPERFRMGAMLKQLTDAVQNLDAGTGDTRELHKQSRGLRGSVGVSLLERQLSGAELAGLIQRLIDNTISNKIAKQVFDAMWNGEGNADDIIEARGLKQVSDAGALEKLVDEVIAEGGRRRRSHRHVYSG